MASSKKPPFNPNAPLYGTMPELGISERLLRSGAPSRGFSSRFLNDSTFVSFAKGIYPKIQANGKGKVFFETEEQFLLHLDEALHHFEMLRPLVRPDDSGDLNDQRNYFRRLKTTANALNQVLAAMKDTHSRRLAHAGFVLPQHLTGEGLDNKFIQQSRQLEQAAAKAIIDLKGKNSGRHAELYLLIEQLADMHKDWPTRTNNDHNRDNKGVFFELVQAIRPLVGLTDDLGITDNTILDGIKLAKKT